MVNQFHFVIIFLQPCLSQEGQLVGWLVDFTHLRVFQMSCLIDSMCHQVSITILRNLASLNNAAVWMVSTCPLISKSSIPFTNPVKIVPSVPITVGITVTFIDFLVIYQCVDIHLSFLFLLIFPCGLPWRQNQQFGRPSFFFLTMTKSSQTAEIKWSVCISKFQRSLCVLFSKTDSRLCIYYLFVWSNFNFLHNSQWITFPTQTCLVFYSLNANLLHSRIIWFFSSLSPHNLHLLFCCVFFLLFLL